MTLQMKHTLHRTALALTLSLWGIAAHAGPAIDQFKRDIAAFTAAQAATSGKTIQYTDPQGVLARAVLNPGRIPSVVDDGKFSADFTPVARARLEALRASLPKP